MKKIFAVIMLFLGITSQAQTFDFSCAPPPDFDLTILMKTQSGDKYEVTGETINETGEYTFIYNLPENLEVIKTFNGDTNFSKIYKGVHIKALPFNIDATYVSFSVKIDEEFEWGIETLKTQYSHALFIGDAQSSEVDTDIVINYMQGHGQPNLTDTVTISESPENSELKLSMVDLTGGLEFIEQDAIAGDNLGITGISYNVSVNDTRATTALQLSPSFKANGTEIIITVDLSSYIQPLENNVVVGVDLVGLTLTSSHTFTSDNDGEVITLTYQVPEGYTVTSYIGPSEDFTPAGSEFTVTPAGDVGLNHTSFSLHVTPPATIDYSDTETELSIDLSKFITKDAEVGFTQIIGDVTKVLEVGGGTTEWNIFDYSGTVRFTINGTTHDLIASGWGDDFPIEGTDVTILAGEESNWSVRITNATQDNTITWELL